jgi:hypothetical protein
MGSRASLGIRVSVVALAGSFGVVMGLVAGYVGGRTDSVIMRAIDTQIAFPGLLLAHHSRDHRPHAPPLSSFSPSMAGWSMRA